MPSSVLLAQLLDGCSSLQRWQLPSAITYANKMRHIRISRRIRCAIISAAISHRANTAIRGCQHLLPWHAHRAIFHADGCCCASCSTPLWLAAIFGPKQTIFGCYGSHILAPKIWPSASRYLAHPLLILRDNLMSRVWLLIASNGADIRSKTDHFSPLMMVCRSGRIRRFGVSIFHP